jgi:hypothetical protein
VIVKEACEDAAQSFSLIHGHVPTVLRALAGSDSESALAENELRGLDSDCGASHA